MGKISASIIIPTFNKLSRLRLVLKSLEHQITDEVEVIIVFDGCDQEVIDAFHCLEFKFKPIEIICEKNVGRACARNKGIIASKGDIILFLDDDRIVASDYIKSHIAAHKSRHVAVLGTRMEIFLTDDEIKTYYDHYDECIQKCRMEGDADKGYSFSKILDRIVPWNSFFTGNVSVAREDLDGINGFDENFKGWGHEDIDLGIGLSYNKVRIIKDNSCINYHLMHPSNFNDKRKEAARNMRYLLKKHRKKYRVAAYLRVVYIKQVIFGIHISKKQYQKYKLRREL